MSTRVFKRMLWLQLAVSAVFVAIGTAVLLNPRASPVAAVLIYAMVLVAAAGFHWRRGTLRASVERVKRELETVRLNDLEGATPVSEREGVAFEEELAANPAFAHMLASRAVRLYAKGTFEGQAVEIGTAVVTNRDFDTFVSHVLIEKQGLRAPFRCMTKGTLTSLARKGMSTSPTLTGDSAFDEAWVVDADADVARAALTDDVRAALLRLQSQLSWMTVASVEVTSHGLVLRWPGELSTSFAAHLRDLALKIAAGLSPR